MGSEQWAKCPQACIQKCLQGDEKSSSFDRTALYTSSAFSTSPQTIPLQSFLYFPFFYIFPRSIAPFFADKRTRFFFFSFSVSLFPQSLNCRRFSICLFDCHCVTAIYYYFFSCSLFSDSIFICFFPFFSSFHFFSCLSFPHLIVTNR